MRWWNDQWFERVWNQRDRTAIFELMHDGCRTVGLPLGDRTPKDAFAAFHGAVLAAFEDFRITPFVWTEEGDTITGHGQIQGRHRASGKDVDFRFAYRAVWKDGLVTDADNLLEWHTAFAQVGILGENGLSELLAGPE